MIDEWKEIKDTNGRYFINTNGDICSVRYVHNRGYDSHYKFSPLHINHYKNGYCFVALSVNGKIQQRFVHRLVMETFVGESELEVNHKDGNKNNNSLWNLEYVSHSQNQLHSFRVLKRPPVKSWLGKSGFNHNKSHHIKLTNIKTGERIEYGSLREAQSKGEKRYEIAKCLKENKLYKNIFKVERI